MLHILPPPQNILLNMGNNCCSNQRDEEHLSQLYTDSSPILLHHPSPDTANPVQEMPLYLTKLSQA